MFSITATTLRTSFAFSSAYLARAAKDEEALAIVEDGTTVWGLPRDNSDKLEIVAASRLVKQAERIRDEAVIRGRHEGLPWIVIGDALGVSAEAARKKYNNRV